jgi:hypothetical protein
MEVAMTNSRIRTVLSRGVGAGVLVLASLGLATPAHAATHYITFVTYYSDPGLTNVTGARTWDDCPGEEGTWGWGGGAYHTIESEPCP